MMDDFLKMYADDAHEVLEVESSAIVLHTSSAINNYIVVQKFA